MIELLGLAASVSLLAGWRLYMTVFATGVAMRLGWIDLPTQLGQLDILASPWVIGAAGVGLAIEFLADKIAWLDSAWDTVHAVIRPLGGALLALTVIDAQDPVWQTVSFLLGGGGAMLTHSAKAATRVAVNASPEPYSNIAVSTGEDIATAGLLALAFANPAIALVIAVMLVIASAAVLWLVGRLVRRLLGSGAARTPAAPPMQ